MRSSFGDICVMRSASIKTHLLTLCGRWICSAMAGLRASAKHHFKGRSWRGLHRSALITMIALAASTRLRSASGRRPRAFEVTCLRALCQIGSSSTQSLARRRSREFPFGNESERNRWFFGPAVISRASLSIVFFQVVAAAL